MFTQSIPFTGHHGSIVIGKGGNTIKQITNEMGCYIETKKPEPHMDAHCLTFILVGIMN